MTMRSRTFRADEALDAKLIETAHREGRSVQDVMRTAVAEYIDARGKRIDDLVDRIKTEDAGLLDRLSK